VARLVALAVLAGGAVSTAAAQQSDSAGPGDPDGHREGTEWGLGIGVIAKQDAYKGIKRDTMAVPVLRFENEYVEFFGLGLEVKLPSLRLGERSRIKFGLVGKADLNGYEAKDSPFLAGMAERKGGKMRWWTSAPSGPPTRRATARAGSSASASRSSGTWGSTPWSCPT
jgi:outer membrane protein